MTAQPRLGDVVAALEQLYPQAWAQPWDAVGLVCGDPAAPVRRVLFAVDPVAAVVDEALEFDADLVVSHHPLLLRAVHGVPASDPKGLVVHRLIGAGAALYVAHTNADVADSGVSDALAALLRLTGTMPLEPDPTDPRGRRGLGRVGTLEGELTLREFIDVAAAALPVTGGGLRAAGDLATPVRRVAVCGGAGDSVLAAARDAAADVFLTADLRHHPASESLERGAPALVDASHWATEWPWLDDVARRLTGTLTSRGVSVETRVSTRVTDPWTCATAVQSCS